MGDRRVSRWLDRGLKRLPGPLPTLVERARKDDLLLFAASLAFYALVSLPPLVVTVMWITSLVLGEERLRQVADVLSRSAPKELGAGEALKRVAELGTSLGATALIAALWPASAYGSGLQRAFDHLSSGPDLHLEGLRGRGLLLMGLLPVMVIGSLVASLLGTTLVGDGMGWRFVGLLIALPTGFLAASVGTVVVYRLFPPARLRWSAIFRGTAVTAAGVSILSALFVLYLIVGANFQERYVTSGLAGVVLLGLWLYLSNVMLLLGYRFGEEFHRRSEEAAGEEGREGTEEDGRGDDGGRKAPPRREEARKLDRETRVGDADRTRSGRPSPGRE